MLSIRLSRIFIFASCLLLPASVFAQELCNNGLDDDNDGFTDCYDSDCAQQGNCNGFFYGYPVYHCDMQPPVGTFGLALEWQSTLNVSTRSTAFVGDVDNDGTPEVITHNLNANQLYILNGITGAVEVTINCPAISDYSDAITVADTDNDGFGEIYVIDDNNFLRCFEHTGPAKAGFVPTNTGNNEGSPGIADFNADGTPEVYFGNRIYHSQTGALIASGGAGSKGVNPAAVAWHSAAGDVLPAVPGLELICGNTVYVVNIGASLVMPEPNNLGPLPDGFTSLADMDMDGLLDVVVTSNGDVWCWNPVSGTQIGNTFPIPNTGKGGRPNIADYDNDGQPEIGVGGNNRYVVVDFNIGTSTFSQLWVNNTVDGSQMTTGSAFDFEGDGITEVVYRDENDLYVYDGATGAVKASIPCGSATRTEYPTVADVDGDGTANIICNCDVTNQGGTGKVRVYSSAGIPWVDSRSVMNQHAYSVCNINDDLSVPILPQSNTAVPELNRFISQVPLYDKNWNPQFIPVPDLTITIDTVEVCNAVNYVDVTVTICNIGSNNVDSIIPVSFYDGNPLVGGSHIATGNFTAFPLDTPLCVTMTIPVNWSQTAFDLFAVVNDLGFAAPADAPECVYTECDSTNNMNTYYVEPYTMVPTMSGLDADYCPVNIQVTLTGNPAGGIFSGPGIAGNNFNPSVAGEGLLQDIVYTYMHGVCPFAISQEVTVFALPVVDFTASTVCAGSVTNFMDMSTVNNSFISLWDWNFGDNSAHPVDQNTSHIYNTGNVYNVTLTATSDDGCVNSATEPVRVHVNPIADFTATNSCFNDTSTFTDNSSISSGTIVDWTWSFGNGVFGYSQDTIYVYPAAATYTAGIQVISDSGCVATHTETVIVSHLPVAGFSFDDICLSNQADFVDESTILSGNIDQWQWDFDDGTSSTDQNPLPHDFPDWGAFDVTLIVTAGGFCRDTLTQMIAVYPMPEPIFSATMECMGTPTVFSDLSDVVFGSVESWTYNFDDNGIITNNSNPLYTFSTYGIFDVNLEVASDFGCITDTVIPVTVYPVATADFSAAPVCLGSTTSFIDESTIPQDNIVQWDWSFNDGGTSTLQNAFHTYANSGLFNVNLIVTSNNGCVSDTMIEVEVYPVPIVNFSADILEGCQPLLVQFTDLSLVNPGYIINWWFWDFGDGNSSSAQNPLHVYDTAGVFDVTLQAKTSNGCTVMLTDTAMITVHPKPVAAFAATPQRTEIIYPRIEIEDFSSGVSLWQYDFGDSTNSPLQQPVQLYNSIGVYEIRQIVTTDFGCKDTAYFTVYIDPSFTFYIPNAFSPNADGNNDYFFGSGIGITNYEMRIFNRWGDQVFTSFDENEKWNGTLRSGKLAMQDVYVYTFVVRDVYTEQHTFRGKVTLLSGEPQE